MPSRTLVREPYADRLPELIAFNSSLTYIYTSGVSPPVHLTGLEH